jgi:hypothetical protein
MRWRPGRKGFPRHRTGSLRHQRGRWPPNRSFKQRWPDWEATGHWCVEDIENQVEVSPFSDKEQPMALCSRAELAWHQLERYLTDWLQPGGNGLSPLDSLQGICESSFPSSAGDGST